MPTYVYECSSCNDRFEVEQRITENALDTCQCGSAGTVKRVIQPVGIMFKGSGFHINDYSGTSEIKPEPKAEAKLEASAVPESSSAAPTPPAESSDK
jgi:putative FmdB family regulatory protein